MEPAQQVHDVHSTHDDHALQRRSEHNKHVQS